MILFLTFHFLIVIVKGKGVKFYIVHSDPEFSLYKEPLVWNLVLHTVLSRVSEWRLFDKCQAIYTR